MNALLLGGIVLMLILQIWEVRRRVRDPDTLTARQFWRRLITAGILQLVLVMWLVGEPLMRHQSPLARLAYWTAALLLPIGAVFAALREMVEVSRQYNRQRAALFRSADDGTGDAPPGTISRPTGGGDRSSA
jgi:hypothetical protein